MDAPDDVKKRAEQRCIDDVLKVAKCQHGRSRRILELLSGEEIIRDITEHPDFVKCCAKNGTEESPFLLGIEHFQVDHFSEKKRKDEKMISKSGKMRKNIDSLQRRWGNRVIHSKEIPQGAIDDLCNVLTEGLQNKISASYRDFILSFRHSLDKHLKKASYYYESIKSVSKSNLPIKLMLLIEVYSDFRNLFLNSDGKCKLEKDWILPIFDDVVQLLETIDTKQFQFVVLCFRDVICVENYRVIALQTRNIRKDLARQHIPVYHYICEDIYLEKSQRARQKIDVSTKYIEGDESKINLLTQACFQEITPEYATLLIFKAFLDTLKHAERKEPFATTQNVQCLFETFGRYCLHGLNQLNENNILHMIQQIAYINRISYIEEAENFARKWGISNKDE